MSRRWLSILFLSVFLLGCWSGSALAQSTAIVTADVTILRDAPRPDGANLGSLSKGTECDVIENAGLWVKVKVRTSGQVGFLHSLTISTSRSSTTAVSGAGTPTASRPAPRVDPPVPMTADNSQAVPRKFWIRALGGLASGVGMSTWAVGGGLITRPFSNERLEVAGDVVFSRYGSGTLYSDYQIKDSWMMYSLAGNVEYLFGDPGASVHPYVGGGLVIGVASGSTSVKVYGYELSTSAGSGSAATLQLLGGVDVPMGNSRAFRGEIRTAFYSGFTGLLLLGSYSF